MAPVEKRSQVLQQSSDNRSYGFGAKFLLKKLSASDFSYERKSAFKLFDRNSKSELKSYYYQLCLSQNKCSKITASLSKLKSWTTLGERAMSIFFKHGVLISPLFLQTENTIYALMVFQDVSQYPYPTKSHAFATSQLPIWKILTRI